VEFVVFVLLLAVEILLLAAVKSQLAEILLLAAEHLVQPVLVQSVVLVH
jgi:hypothetical protein